MSTVLIGDVEAELGRSLSSEMERAQVGRWIEAVEALIRKRLGGLERLDLAALRVVIPQVVARKARNPEGKQNERIDDYSYGLTSAAAAADLTLTDAEWKLITPDEQEQTGAFTITPTYTPGVAAW